MKRAIGVLLGCVLAQLAQAQMYKCVGPQGTTQYSDKPRPGCEKEADIQPIPPVWGKVTPYKEDLKAAEHDFQERRRKLEREQAAEEKRRADNRRACDNLKAEHARYVAVRRMDSEVRDRKLKQLSEEITKRRCD